MPRSAERHTTLNAFAALSRLSVANLRLTISKGTGEGAKPATTFQQSDCEMLLPVQAATHRFYASIHHATNVGRMFRRTTACCRITSTFPSPITARSSLRRQWHRGDAARGATGEGKYGPTEESITNQNSARVLGPGNCDGGQRSRLNPPRITSRASAW